MLQQLSEQLHEYHRRAADAKAQANATADPALKKSYADLEDRWLFLACSFMFTESLQDFIEGRQRKKESPSVDPNQPMVGQLFELLPGSSGAKYAAIGAHRGFPARLFSNCKR